MDTAESSSSGSLSEPWPPIRRYGGAAVSVDHAAVREICGPDAVVWRVKGRKPLCQAGGWQVIFQGFRLDGFLEHKWKPFFAVHPLFNDLHVLIFLLPSMS